MIRSCTTSGPAPVKLTSGGVPSAMLSTVTSPKGSFQDGRSERSMAFSTSATSSRWPRK